MAGTSRRAAGLPMSVIMASKVAPAAAENGDDEHEAEKLKGGAAACENSHCRRSFSQSSGGAVQFTVATLAGWVKVQNRTWAAPTSFRAGLANVILLQNGVAAMRGQRALLYEMQLQRVGT